MKLPNAYQMKELEAYTIQHDDIKSIDLMETAAMKIASKTLRGLKLSVQR